MNLLTRQQYQDKSAQEAIERGYDLVQLKYDGWWDRVEILDGVVQHYSQTGRLFKEHTCSDRSFRATLIGEHMMGTQWSQEPGRLGKTYLFDCWRWGETELREINYRDRYRIARLAPASLSELFEPVTTYRIDHWKELWDVQVVGGAYEGLVYRKGSDDVTGIVYREKLTLTSDYTCLGFVQGQGKFANTLGAILIGDVFGVPILTDSGDQATVSGGTMTDEERLKVWDNQPFYLGKIFEASGKARFKSGLLRHPNFERWRNDK